MTWRALSPAMLWHTSYLWCKTWQRAYFSFLSFFCRYIYSSYIFFTLLKEVSNISNFNFFDMQPCSRTFWLMAYSLKLKPWTLPDQTVLDFLSQQHNKLTFFCSGDPDQVLAGNDQLQTIWPTDQVGSRPPSLTWGLCQQGWPCMYPLRFSIWEICD